MNEEYTIPPVAVLGSTGSVGRQTLDVCHRFGVRVDALTGGKNTAELEKQIRRFNPRVCAMADADAARDLAARVRDMRTKVYAGADGILRVIDETDAKTAVNSILGLAGLAPTLATRALSPWWTEKRNLCGKITATVWVTVCLLALPGRSLSSNAKPPRSTKRLCLRISKRRW